jgi:pantoate--beta-alanine ligase
MGYLHEGHLSLMAAAAEASDTVMASLFVNPLQFGADEDLGLYPRDLQRDAALAAAEGVDVLFAPALEEMYPGHPSTRVTVDALALGMEGMFRPGHFEGVATVVTKLLAGLQPDQAWFGRKDAQQFAVIRRLARDLSIPVEVRAGSTVREPDGLALSSRNVFLEAEHRAAARSLSVGLFAAADLVEAGERDAVPLEEAVLAATCAAGLTPQYVELADAEDAVRLTRLRGEAFLAVAVPVGLTRLIDNVWFLPDGDGYRADRGVLLERPSVLYQGGT